MKRLVRAVAAMLFLGWSNAVPAADRIARASLFDAHLHYNEEARARFSVAQTLAQLQAEGVGAVIATSTPNDGPHELAMAAPVGRSLSFRSYGLIEPMPIAARGSRIRRLHRSSTTSSRATVAIAASANSTFTAEPRRRVS